MKPRPGKLRILIADDHEMVRQGLKRVLGMRPGWEVCGEAANGLEAVELARRLKPDIVVLDLSMPRVGGLVATREIRKALPQTEVLILTMYDSEQLIREVLAAGARGYLLKSDAGALLLAAVESISRRQPFFTPKVGDFVLRGFLKPASGADASSGKSALTLREGQVLKLVAEGLSSKEIARTLGLSVKTVETHRSNMMRKLDLHSVAAVVHFGLGRGGTSL
jgi:DNA-binding NarL/FixJ family response regulator